MIEIKSHPPPLSINAKQNLLTEAEQRRLKLKKSTQAFESIFIAQLLKNMRSVSFDKEEDGFGKSIMLSMADESVSQQLSKTNMLGVGKMLYQHLLKRLDAEPVEMHKLKIGKPNPVIAAASPAAAPPPKLKVAPKSHNVETSRAATPVKIEVTHKNKLAPPRAVTSAAKAPQSGSHSALDRYVEHIRAAADETQLPESLLKAMIMRESSGNASAVSSKGAAGLMQLMPDTAKAMGVSDPFDPRESILGGAKYLRSLLDRFKDLRMALAAYNAGPTRVAKYGGMPPFADTVRYVEQVLADVNKSDK